MVERDNPTLLGFLKSLLNPTEHHEIRPDLDVALVMADWLEEQGDPRAADVRAIVASRSALAKSLNPRARKVFWRWPPADARDRPWWDLLIESIPKRGYYVRWHVDVRSEVGRKLGRVHANGELCERKDVPRQFERRLAELIVRLLGWTENDLRS